jgi:hypothetical protein
MIITTTTTENSVDFHQGMVSRMDMSFAKYGRFKVNATGELDKKFVKNAIDFLSDLLAQWQNKPSTTANSNVVASIILRLIKYLRTGNTEWLMDVANFAMIEFECPQIKSAHFRATDSHESPGLVGLGEKEMERI